IWRSPIVAAAAIRGFASRRFLRGWITRSSRAALSFWTTEEIDHGVGCILRVNPNAALWSFPKRNALLGKVGSRPDQRFDLNCKPYGRRQRRQRSSRRPVAPGHRRQDLHPARSEPKVIFGVAHRGGPEAGRGGEFVRARRSVGRAQENAAHAYRSIGMREQVRLPHHVTSEVFGVLQPRLREIAARPVHVAKCHATPLPAVRSVGGHSLKLP